MYIYFVYFVKFFASFKKLSGIINSLVEILISFLNVGFVHTGVKRVSRGLVSTYHTPLLLPKRGEAR